MATKKNPIQRVRTQIVTAPRAELRTTRTIIPRRDLLTGAALVLVGSGSGCGKNQPTSSGGACWQLRTQFMADFTNKFIGDWTKIKPQGTADNWPDPDNVTDPPTRVWPKKTQTQPEIVNDYITFANVLMTVGYVMAPLPTFPSGSLGDDIVQFLKLKSWPAATPVFPPPPPPPAPPPLGPYQNSLPTVHLLEIAVILDRLLQAMNSFNPVAGAGGGPGSWPPH
jgi:hypothetical protein